LAHEQTPLSNDTIVSILRHWEVGRAKDLSAPPHIELKHSNCYSWVDSKRSIQQLIFRV